jgi:EAL domain-containing protein (putative c-di-GMP-specific phosphodiesterase class I)
MRYVVEDQARITEAVRRAADPLQVMQRVADQTCALIQGAEGALIALWDDGDVLTYVCGSGYLERFAGLTLDVANSLAGHAVLTGAILRSDDTGSDPRVDAEECRQFEMLSLVCVPLVRGRRTFGVMTVSSPRTAAFDTADELILRGLADFVGVVVAAASDLDRITSTLLADDSEIAYLAGETDRQREIGPDTARLFVANVLSPDAASDLVARKRIEQALTAGGFAVVYQPIVNLQEGKPVGFEALTRFHSEPSRPPNLWFEEAHAVGLGVEMELAAAGLALSHQAEFPADMNLAVNVGPLALTSPAFREMLGRVDAEHVVVELTEQAEIRDYSVLNQAISTVRSIGARLAVDDTGAGVSSLAHILKLAPDWIKLDRALTTGVDRDPVRRALASSLVTFANETGSLIVAEGIETDAELAVLRSLGIRYGQGFYLRPPTSLDALLDDDPYQWSNTV